MIFLGHNATTGVTTYGQINPDNPKEMIYQRTQDVEGIINECARIRSEGDPNKKSGFRHLGKVPMHILGEMMRDGRSLDQEAIRKWLRENDKFQTVGKTW